MQLIRGISFEHYQKIVHKNIKYILMLLSVLSVSLLPLIASFCVIIQEDFFFFLTKKIVLKSVY